MGLSFATRCRTAAPIAGACASILAVLFLAGCSSSSSDSVGPTNSGVVTSAVQTVRCPTSFGSDGEKVNVPPAMLDASLDPGAAHSLRFYVGGLTVLAPAGWGCSSEVGADGSSQIDVSPSGSTSFHPQQGVSASDMSACQGCIADLACPFFANARADLGFSDLPCPAQVPAGELVSHDEPYVVSFTDPPGVKGNGLDSGGANPARGLVIYVPPTAGDAAGDEILCTLPMAQQPLCDAIFSNYLASYKQHYPWPSVSPSAAPEAS